MRKENRQMNRSSRWRLLARALIFFVAMVLVGGAVVDAYVWHRDSTRPRTAVFAPPVATPVVTPTPTASAPAPIPVPTSSLVADVAVPAISVYGAPALGKVLASVPNVNAMGQKEALLVTDASVPGWYEVQVPVRPSGSQGWVQASSVTIREVPDYIRVYQSQFRLEYYVAGQLKKSFTVAVGAPSTPTPYGHFYIWASEPYGGGDTPPLFSPSALSPGLENWPGGGRTRLHRR